MASKSLVCHNCFCLHISLYNPPFFPGHRLCSSWVADQLPDSDMGLSRSDGSAGKERMRWTDELHQQFEQAVNKLGGPDYYTLVNIVYTHHVFHVLNVLHDLFMVF